MRWQLRGLNRFEGHECATVMCGSICSDAWVARVVEALGGAGRLVWIGLVIVAILMIGGADVASASVTNASCFDCHDDDTMESVDASGRILSAHVAPRVFEESVHGVLDCIDCHEDVTDADHDESLAPVDCSMCHDVDGYPNSEHARKRAVRSNETASASSASADTSIFEAEAAVTEGASCADCHGHAHAAASVESIESPMHPLNQVEACGRCHSHLGVRTSVAEPVESFLATVHGRVLSEGNLEAATCTDCHGGHDIRTASTPGSRVSKVEIPATCGACHEEEFAQFEGSVHGARIAEGILDAPVCTDCHGEHSILAASNPASTVFASTVSTVTCASCHAAERLTQKLDMEGDRVSSYLASYHGLASRMGINTVTSCASCHGVHDILPSSDPRSRVHPEKLTETCGACHAGITNASMVGVRIHGAPEGGQGRAVRAVTLIYLILIPLVIGGMVWHNGLDLWRKLRVHLRAQLAPRSADTPMRWSRSERFQHVVLLVSFVVLAYSGFALRFPTAWWGEPFRMLGGEGLRQLIHRGAALGFIAVSLLHTVHVLASPRGRRLLRGMTPVSLDVSTFFAFATGRQRKVPEPHGPGQFSYIAKAEYWALVWGTWLMALTGFALWFHDWTLTNLPAWAPDVSTEVHFYEAVLATLAILVWHIYRVIFDPDVYPLDTAMMNGRPPLEHGGSSEPPPGPKPEGAAAGSSNGGASEPAIPATPKH